MSPGTRAVWSRFFRLILNKPFGVEIPSLAPGSPANVCLADLAAEWEVGEAGYESRSSNCAFGIERPFQSMSS